MAFLSELSRILESRTRSALERATGDAAGLERAGVPTYYGLHSLRHTFGSGYISRGVSPASVQQQMGQASIEQAVGI